MSRCNDRLFFSLGLASLIAGVVAAESLGQTAWTNGGSDFDWNNAANWSAGLPTAATQADFSNAGAAGTITLSATGAADKLFATATGYTLANNGTNFLVLDYNNSTGSATTDANSLLLVTGGTFNVGTGSDATVVKANGSNLGFSSQILVGSGSTLNINAGASVIRDNNPANGGLRFVGNGTVNLFGTVSLLQGNDGIRVSERDNDTIVFNVKSGGVMTANTSAGNESNASIWVAGGAAGTGAGLNTLTIESGGSVTVIPNATNAFGLTRNAGPTSVTNLAGTLTAPRVISLASTGALNFTGGTLVANAANASYIASAAFVGGTLTSVSGGTIDNGGYAIGIDAGISGAGGMAFAGSGTTTLSGASTFAGGAAVNAGTLAVTGSLASSLTVGGGATLAGSGATTGAASFAAGSYLLANTSGSAFTANGVTFAGQTRLQFNGAVTTGATYDVIGYGAGGVTGLGNLVSTSRATIADNVINSTITATADGVATETWGGGSGTWAIGGSGWTGSFSNFYNGDTAVFGTGSGAATITLSDSLGALLPAAVEVNSGTDFEFAGPGAIGGTAAITKDGPGGLTIATANSYSGGTVLNAGVLNINAAAALGTGALTINGGTLGNSSGASVTASANNAQTWAGDFSFAGPDDLILGTGAVTASGGDRTVTASTGTLSVGRITNASGGLTKAGGGTLTVVPVGGSSSVTGTLTVSGGTLNIGSQDFLAAALAGSGTIANGSGTTRWLIVNDGGTDYAFAGSLVDGGGAGLLGFSKQGTGTVTLSGESSYSDTTTLGGGTLVVANPQALGNTARVNMSTNTTLSLATDGGDNTTRIGFGSGSTVNLVSDRATPGAGIDHPMSVLAGAGIGHGTVNITAGGNVTSGTASLSFDVLRLGAGTTGTTLLNPTTAVVTLGDVNKSNNNVSQTLGLGGTTTGNLVTGVISNGAPLTGGNAISVAKSNASTWTLSGNSTYTGTTTVSGGTLYVNGDNSAATGAVTVSGGRLGGTGILGGAISVDAGGVLAAGASIGVLSGTQSVAFTNGSTFAYEFDTAAVDGDLLQLTGGLTLSGTATLTLTDLSTSTAVADGTVMSLVNYGGSWNSGLFSYLGSPLADGDSLTLGANEWRIDYASAVPGVNVATPSGASYVNLTAVPEPAALAVSIMGGIALAAAAMRRRRAG